MCNAPGKDDAKRQSLQSHYCDGLRLGLRPLVKTRSPTCRDHVEKQTQKFPEPCSGRCVAVTQRPYAISGASACHFSCIVGLVVRDMAEHMTSRVSKQVAGTTRQYQHVVGRSEMSSRDPSSTRIICTRRKSRWYCGRCQNSSAAHRGPKETCPEASAPDVGTADAKYHHR